MKQFKITEINLPFEKDNKYFQQLFNSISKVEKRYVKYEVCCSLDRYEYQLHLERVFAYELYRQWANNIENDSEALILNAEINKTININTIECNLTNHTDNNVGEQNEIMTLYPDIVLHHSQEDDKSQIMICEIKRDYRLSGAKIFGDIFKIIAYMTEECFCENYRPFKYGAFIIVGCNIKQLKELFDKDTKIKVNTDEISFGDFIKNNQASFERLICVSYDGENLEYERFSDLREEWVNLL